MMMGYLLLVFFSASFFSVIFIGATPSPGERIISFFFLFLVLIALFSSRWIKQARLNHLLPFSFLVFYGIGVKLPDVKISSSNILFFILLILLLVEIIRLRLWHGFSRLDYAFFASSLFVFLFSPLIIRINNYLGGEAPMADPAFYLFVARLMILYLGARLLLSREKLAPFTLIVGLVFGVFINIF
jgi:hypothetical protein